MADPIKNKTIRKEVIPLDWEERYKAVKKELVCRYNKDKSSVDLFIVSPDDKSLLIDITANIRDKIDKLGGDTIILNIDGVGEISLQKLIVQMQAELSNAVIAVGISDDISYVSDISTLDNASLHVNKIGNEVEIVGFAEAEENTIMLKRGGVAVWVPMISSENTKITQPTNSNTGQTTSTDSTSSNSGEIIQPGSPDDGFGLKCVVIDPSDHRLYLRASRRQKSLFISGNNRVILPTPLDEKTDIEWMLLTNNGVPNLTFPTNVFWKNLPTPFQPNTMYEFIFKTWDGGKTWSGDYTGYNNNSSNAVITKDFLDSNYYTKNEMNSILSWGTGDETIIGEDGVL